VSRRLTIVRSGVPVPDPAADEIVVPFDEFVGWVRSGAVLAHLGRHAEGRLLVHRIETAGRPLPLGLALRAMSRGRVLLTDLDVHHGTRLAVRGCHVRHRDRHAQRRPALLGRVWIVLVASARCLFPGDRTPHIAVTLCDPDVGDAISHFPVTGRVRRKGRPQDTRQKNS